MMSRGLIIASLLALTAPAFAQDAPQLSEEEVKERSLAIEKTLRCVVCQNQPIADSNSTLAEDMRNLVEHRVRLGDSDDEVRAYMQARYGDFVLMTPPVKPYTWALWFGPLVLLAGAGVWYVLNVRKPQTALTGDTDDLSPEEVERLRDILGNTRDEDKTA